MNRYFKLLSCIALFVNCTFFKASAQSIPTITNQPTAGKNYVLTRTFREAGVTLSNINAARTVDKENQSIQYLDGLGRPIQSIAIQGSPGFGDMVQHMEYDAMGRQSLSYGAYTSAQQNGAFRSGALAETKSFYQNPASGSGIQVTAYPYARTVHEASPLGRVKEQGAVGAVWQPHDANIGGSGHTVKMDYGANAVNEVRLWRVTGGSAADGTGYYAANKLYKTVVKDENWVSGKGGTVEEFKDFEGRAVLKRVWKNETEALDTYYVYDIFSNLRYVIPPGFTGSSIVETDASFDQYIYAYRYDGRKRLIEEKLPGRGWEYFIYNKADEIIMTQDALLRSKSVGQQWKYIKYDALGRTVESGIHSGNYADRAAAQAAVDNHWNNTSARWEKRDNLVYSNVSFPTTGLTPLLVNYYDDYNFEGASSLPYSNGSIAKSNLIQIMATGSKVYKDDGTLPLYSVVYYDDKGRVIQQAAQNHLGGTDYVTNTYSFVGELLTSTRVHTANGQSTTTVTTNEYDHVGRLLATKHKVNGQDEVTLAKLIYNELGQLTQKMRHSEDLGANYLDTVRYAYNERGWTTSAKSGKFSYELRYNNATNGVPQYNGNISEQHWTQHGHGAKYFIYDYDPLNRLKDGNSVSGGMCEQLTYDDMGNIESLTRDNGVPITYNYMQGAVKTNRLQSLSGGLGGSYTYDANGNAESDRNGMAFTYNHLNLPKTASKTGINVAYLYDAMGDKLRKTATLGTVTTQRDYVGGIEYNGTNIDLIHTGEGVASKSGTDYIYHYNLTDHLGNPDESGLCSACCDQEGEWRWCGDTAAERLLSIWKTIPEWLFSRK